MKRMVIVWQRSGALLGVLGAVVGAVRTAVAQSGPPAARIDSSWLSSDTVTRTADFSLIAGFSGLNGALNFNGFRDGALMLAVPLNWRVVIHFTNHDGMLPHSSVVIAQGPIPTTGTATPAFSRAITLKPQEGLTSTETDDIRFVADKAGAFLIICGVPGHAAAGMWIRFKVDSQIRIPSLRLTRSGQ
jgi:FtsP/CotA-like multicopper oxidase with cupredoxin domain